MAGMTRADIIALAVSWAGRKGQRVDVVKEFNFILQDMSRRYPLLRDKDTGNLTADQNYIDLPSDYRSQDLFNPHGYLTAFKVDGDWVPWLKNDLDFWELDQTQYGAPVYYAVFEDPETAKIYFYPKYQTDTPAYEFLYHKIHEKSASGDNNYLHKYGEKWDEVVVNGVAWRAARTIEEADLEAKYLAHYMGSLTQMFSLIKPARYRRTAYHHF